MSKKWIKKFFIILISFIILICLTPTLLKSMGYTYAIGRYIPAANNQHMIVYYDKEWDEEFSDYMIYEKNDLFHKLSVGDKILIIKLYGAMRNDIEHNHLYVFQGFKLADGTIDDIPSKLIRYVDKTDNQTVTLSAYPLYLTLKLPDKWSYSYLPDKQGISIFPSYSPEGRVDLMLYQDGFPTDSLKDYRADTGKLDYFDYNVTRYYNLDSTFVPTSNFFDLRAWDYIHFSEPYEQYVIYNNGAEKWTREQNLQLQDILNTIELK